MKKLHELIDELGLSYKKEILSFCLFNLLIIGGTAFLYFFRHQAIVFLYGTIFSILFSVFFFLRYGSMKKKREANNNDEFVNLFTFFGIYIHNGYNVYQALNAVAKFASSNIRKNLEKLIASIDVDKSITPFVVFSSCFSNLEIKSILLSVYQMVEEGGGDSYIRQFEVLFGRLSLERHKLQKESRISSLSFLSFLPLAGTALSMISLTAAIAEIMGGYYNVL